MEWMISKSGQIYAVDKLIYIEESNTENNIFAVQWLLKHSLNHEIDSKAEQFYQKCLLGKRAEELYFLQNALNEEFIRVCSKAKCESREKTLYFYISSEDYHWNEAILIFLHAGVSHYDNWIVQIDNQVAKYNPVILKNERYYLI